MHMTAHPVPPAPLIASAINNILDSLDIPRVVVMSHSYGTFITSCILQDSSISRCLASSPHSSISAPAPHPILSKLGHIILVDPIPILLHLPPIAHNFLYRSPSAAAEWQLWYFASTDPDVARTLGRAFFWTEGVAWKEDLRRWMRAEPLGNGDINAGEHNQRWGGRHVAIVLAGKDQIVPAESVRRYLTGLPEACLRWVGHKWANWEEIEPTVVSAGSQDTSSLATTHIHGELCGSEDGNIGTTALEEGMIESCGDLEVIFHPDLDHAMVFDSQEKRKTMLDVVGRYIRDF